MTRTEIQELKRLLWAYVAEYPPNAEVSVADVLEELEALA